ncbi:MAG TPA: hypothetical protein VKS82_05225 [Streptosporangiaceae bacterium]|nr:hypothetical protein [Streptosporangiaceae bacterium]
MHKLMGAVPVSAAALALTAGLGAASPNGGASGTWTVQPGGSIKATASNPTLKDAVTGTTLTCKTLTASGRAKPGSGLSGTGIASITSVTFTTCTGPAGLTFNVTPGHLPWKLNAKSYDAATGVTKGTITGAHGALSGPGCSAVVDGTSATADNGTIGGTYTNSSHELRTLTMGGNLHIYRVSGCFGLIRDGDAATLKGTASVTPGQTITSP